MTNDEKLIDEFITHTLDLFRLVANDTQEAMARLQQLQDDLAALLGAQNLPDADKSEVDKVIAAALLLIHGSYSEQAAALDAVGLAEHVADVTVKALTGVLEIVLGGKDAVVPPLDYLETVAGDAVIQGHPASAWWGAQSEDLQFKFEGQVRQGLINGETNQQIIARIVGKLPAVETSFTPSGPSAPQPDNNKAVKPDDTAGKSNSKTSEKIAAKANPPKAVPKVEPGTPGIMNAARKDVASLVQTSVQSVANKARLATFRKNSDVVKGVQQISTLDGHTSLICIAYSDGQWDLDGNPINGTTLPFNGGPPRHFNCRSVLVAITKTFKDLGIDIEEPEPATRASSSGQVSATTTFDDYLKRMGKDFQDKVLGPGRAELWRAGKISTRDLVNNAGNPLTLDELRAKYA